MEQLSKSANRHHDFKSRSGSSSMTGYANGRVDVMPPNARDEDLNHIPIIEQYELAKRNYERARHVFLHETSKPKHLRDGNLINELNEQCRIHKQRFDQCRVKLHYAQMEMEGAAFKEVCRSRMRQDLYIEICREVEQMKEFAEKRKLFDQARQQEFTK